MKKTNATQMAESILNDKLENYVKYTMKKIHEIDVLMAKELLRLEKKNDDLIKSIWNYCKENTENYTEARKKLKIIEGE